MSDTKDYVSFGYVARNLCGDQCQYVSRYVDGRNGKPNLGVGLRIIGNPANYHSLIIHKDDVEEFVKRYKEETAKYEKTFKI